MAFSLVKFFYEKCNAMVDVSYQGINTQFLSFCAEFHKTLYHQVLIEENLVLLKNIGRFDLGKLMQII
ncbi:hypothetical protein BpHYR1_025969 [Brachionus plicatilis]|uniref:Uncharacterized protein n=1 Tax=Brachionus plicatilis TaxID=10195 RepID=A0A3M7SML1_BRAPC|nr:hypothetical protein BpHYR1_025969 [Brachionus plicatilis]